MNRRGCWMIMMMGRKEKKNFFWCDSINSNQWCDKIIRHTQKKESYGKSHTHTHFHLDATWQRIEVRYTHTFSPNQIMLFEIKLVKVSASQTAKIELCSIKWTYEHALLYIYHDLTMEIFKKCSFFFIFENCSSFQIEC